MCIYGEKIIVLTGLLLSACNGSSGGGSGSSTPTPSPSPTPTSTPIPRGISVLSVSPLLESASIESNGATYALISRSGSLSNPVTIALQSNNPSMSVDENSVTLSVNQSSTYVKLNGLTIGNAVLKATANGYIESSVGFSITSAPLFSCVADISDPQSPTRCGCLNENDGSGLTWYRDGSQTGLWGNWCSGSGVAADPVCTALNPSTQGNNGASLNAFNTKNYCGYSDWHLPTIIDPNKTYIESIGGNWGTIGTYAINNGYVYPGDLSVWFNANNFINITNNSYYWASGSYDNTTMWAPNLKFDLLMSGNVNYSKNVLVVRGSQ